MLLSGGTIRRGPKYIHMSIEPVFANRTPVTKSLINESMHAWIPRTDGTTSQRDRPNYRTTSTVNDAGMVITFVGGNENESDERRINLFMAGSFGLREWYGQFFSSISQNANNRNTLSEVPDINQNTNVTETNCDTHISMERMNCARYMILHQYVTEKSNVPLEKENQINRILKVKHLLNWYLNYFRHLKRNSVFHSNMIRTLMFMKKHGTSKEPFLFYVQTS